MQEFYFILTRYLLLKTHHMHLQECSHIQTDVSLQHLTLLVGIPHEKCEVVRIPLTFTFQSKVTLSAI